MQSKVPSVFLEGIFDNHLLPPRIFNEFHGVGLSLLGDVDVWFHCLVVGVAGPSLCQIQNQSTPTPNIRSIINILMDYRLILGSNPR